MNEEKKLMFLQNMTHMALSHAASTPNQPTSDGKMSHEKMMSFVSQVAQKGLQHFDTGGTTQSGGVLGGVGNFLGTNNQFKAGATPVTAGTNANQLAAGYNQSQNALENQGDTVNALNSGLNQGTNSQNILTNLYTQQANGQGANPAQAQLNQATGQNIAQQAALAAGQRGAASNAGLLARQNAQQGAAIQQQAVGQGATLQAQQQLAAEGNLQNLASTQIGQGAQAVQGLNNAVQNEQNILQGANNSLNNANISQQENINSINGQVAAGNQNANSNLVGGILSGGSALLPLAFSRGGAVPKMAGGGVAGQVTSGPQSYVGQWLNSSVDNGVQINPMITDIGAEKLNPMKVAPMSARPSQPQFTAGDVGSSSITQAGQTDLPTPNLNGGIMTAYKGGLMKDGGNVGGRAKVNHDSLKNDTVPAMLSPGEVVIDKDTLNDPGPAGQMARAVAAHIAHKNKGKKK